MDPSKSLASKRTLAIPELLETILLQLDDRMLLISQRVCHMWANAIKKSPAIQRALFFQPMPQNTPRIYNQLLVEAFPSLFPGNNGEINTFDFTSLDMIARPEKKAAYFREEASWRRMLIAQPPVFAVDLEEADGYRTVVIVGNAGRIRGSDPNASVFAYGIENFFETILSHREPQIQAGIDIKVAWAPNVPFRTRDKTPDDPVFRTPYASDHVEVLIWKMYGEDMDMDSLCEDHKRLQGQIIELYKQFDVYEDWLEDGWTDDSDDD